MTLKFESFFKIAAILAAATIGDGVFALPYVFYTAGWLVGCVYLVLLAGIVIVAHVIYLKVLEKENEKERLLGLSRKYFGNIGFAIGFFSIVAGLLLAMTAFLVLGSSFLGLLFPSADSALLLLLFWLAIALPVFLADGRVIGLELLGIICTSALIVSVFVLAWPHAGFGSAARVGSGNLFLPFGVILFSLAGWTGIEPAYETRRRDGTKGFSPVAMVAAGTVFAAALYLLFVAGILGSATQITADTLSGLSNWPLWQKTALAALGFLAVWTISIPTSREIKNSLEKDLRWPSVAARSLIVFLPPLLVLAGFNNFLFIVGFAGGLFLSIQYLLMIAVGLRVLALSPWKKAALSVVAAVFLLAAVYEVYVFIVR
ncbi:MAG TPA: hypothetical protein VNG29_04035 [Candidatus Paceibacterota bacterium]|nr:hypothetical protein [Candidatus Paceibacterota bacterium]